MFSWKLWRSSFKCKFIITSIYHPYIHIKYYYNILAIHKCKREIIEWNYNKTCNLVRLHPVSFAKCRKKKKSNSKFDAFLIGFSAQILLKRKLKEIKSNLLADIIIIATMYSQNTYELTCLSQFCATSN